MHIGLGYDSFMNILDLDDGVNVTQKNSLEFRRECMIVSFFIGGFLIKNVKGG